MQIVCPHCNFTKEIDETKLPSGAKRATCPKCREKFDLFPKKEQAPPPPPIDEFELEEITPPATDMQTPPPPPPRPTAAPTPGYQAPPLPPKGFGAPTPKGIPWEERKGSLIGDLWETFKLVMFNPNEFFDRMPVDNGLKGPLTFGMIIGSIGIVLLFVLMFLLVGVVGLASGEMGLEAGAMLIGLIIFVILIPIFVAIGLFIGAAIQHLFLMIVGAAGGGFQATFRTLGYASGTYIFSVIPYLGGMVSWVYMVVLMIIGFPKVHNATTGRVVVAVIVLPIALMIAFVVVIGILAAIIIPSMANM